MHEFAARFAAFAEWKTADAATDKRLIDEGLSRVVADAVLAGAKTVRGRSRPT